MNKLLSEIKSQQQTLNDLIAELENKSAFAWNDYQLCKHTTNRVAENLRKIKNESSNQATRILLWDDDATFEQIMAG